MQTMYRNDGVAGAVRALRRAASGVRVLHVGAHPDDEDSALVAWLSLGRNARVSYLSLTRGEGGQNRIGPEKYADLGALRTAELLEARRVDGARQLFGRMIDFGFSKSGEEALRIWGRDEVVADIVRAIRMTRPQVVVSRFNGDPRDGHGQHQAVGMTIRDAFRLAADPLAYPEQLAEGLKPWRATKLYTQTFSPSPEAALTIDTGVYDPLSGRSYASLGYHGRSMHRSQDMGMEEFENATRPSYLIRVAPPQVPGAPDEILADIAPNLPPAAAEIAPLLDSPAWIENPRDGAPGIAGVLKRWRAEAPDDREALEELERALGFALGLRLEALADAPTVAPGTTAAVAARARIPDRAGLADARWTITGAPQPPPDNPDGPTPATVTATDAQLQASPYFLRVPPVGFLYGMPADASLNAAPFEPPAFTATFAATFAGVPFELQVPVERRVADPGFGEIRSDLAVTPRASIRFAPATLYRKAGTPPELAVNIEARNETAEPFAGELEIYAEAAPETTLAAASVALDPGETRSLAPPIAFPSGSAPRGHLLARWTGADAGPAFQVDRMDYRHIRPRAMIRPAALTIFSLDVAIPPSLRVGYVEGSGDEVPLVLKALGVDVKLLADSDLNAAGLAGLDAVVLGIRAYEVRPAARERNAALLDYARAGGTLVVQYNKPEFAAFNVAPFPSGFAEPIAARVTDEAAEVRLLEPNHPIFRYPNRITSADFSGWVQERGLYFWSTWDARYLPLMEMNDPGEEPQRGGLLVAPLGDGHYVYTGLAFFRQLPAGVEGAVRLFVNMISLGRPPAERGAKVR